MARARAKASMEKDVVMDLRENSSFFAWFSRMVVDVKVRNFVVALCEYIMLVVFVCCIALAIIGIAEALSNV